MNIQSFASLLAGLLAATGVPAAEMNISSLSGSVTTAEINSFITFMQEQTPPPTPWGVFNGTTGDHNDWADGTGGREMEAMGEMFEVSSNVTILNQMISWADDCVSQRNDLMSVTNGGRRVMWTGLIDKVWVPNETNAPDPGYAGCENEDTEGHLAFCAKLILQTPSLWNVTVPDGNPYGYGATYFQRATNYLGKCDEANDEYSLKWFIQPGTSLIVAPTNAAWLAQDENVNAINRQMMFNSGFQRLAEAHEILGDNPGRVAQYDAIVAASVGQCLSGMISFDPYLKNGQPVYDWGYYPTTDAPEATEIHAEYDIIGIYRAFNRSSYGLTLSPLVPLANTMVNVIYLGTNTFAGDVDGGSGVQSPLYSGWLLPADWNPAVYTVVAGSAYTNGWYGSSADIEAAILWMKNRRYLEFSITPPPATNFVQAGAEISLTVGVAPLGGFTNDVSLALTGLPAGAGGSFGPATLNLAAINAATTNVTLTITTATTTPTGTYPLNLVGTSGGISHTNGFLLTIGNFGLSASPAALTVLTGSNVSYTVTVATNSGFSGTMTFVLSGLPAGTSAGFSPASLTGAGLATLEITASSNAPIGVYPLTIAGTNGSSTATTTVSLTIVSTNTSLLTWNGGSATDSHWSDAGNWTGNGIGSNDFLFFGGTNRLAGTNDTPAGTAYSNLVFNAGAGAFVLSGNPIVIEGNITNHSTNPQTLRLGLNFNGGLVLDGAANPLIIGGGLTNTPGVSGCSALTLADAGVLTNLLGGAGNPGGTNVVLLNNAGASWTLLDNPATMAVTVPWIFSINAGTFNFGGGGSAPTLTATTVNGAPQDNEVGATSQTMGVFNLLAGTLTTLARLDTATAISSTGIVNQAGGTFNIGSQFQGANGSNPGEVSIVTVSGGTMNLGSAANSTAAFFVASRGTGTLTLSNAAVLNCGTLDVSRNAYGNTIGSIGVVNLNGGTLSVSRVGTATANSQAGPASSGVNPSATFNFNGGMLKATASAANFYQGSAAAPALPITSFVEAGGAIINDGGFRISLLEPLQHDGTLGNAPDGGLTKLGGGNLTLTAASTYTGGTLVGAGTLTVNGSLGATAVTVASNATLAGFGSIGGSVTVDSGGTLAPGGVGVLGSLTVAGGVVLQGFATMDLNRSLLTNDLLTAAGITYGGVLSLTNVAGTLTDTDTFKLFNSPNYAGVFASIVPATPGTGLLWNTNTLNTGVLSITSAVRPILMFTRLGVNGSTLNLSATNGIATGRFVVFETTTLSLPLDQWTPVLTNNFDASGDFNLFTNIVNPALPQQFYLIMQ